MSSAIPAPAKTLLLILLAVLGLAFWFVVRPLLRRVTDEQVALYLEEHEPSLKASVLGALEAGRSPDLDPGLAEAERAGRCVLVDEPHVPVTGTTAVDRRDLAAQHHRVGEGALEGLADRLDELPGRPRPGLLVRTRSLHGGD